MEGILYLTNVNNKKRFVQIDLEKYDADLLQDLIDGLVADSRRDEESMSMEEVESSLRMINKLDV